MLTSVILQVTGTCVLAPGVSLMAAMLCGLVNFLLSPIMTHLSVDGNYLM